MTYMYYLNQKNALSAKIKNKLDLILQGKKEEALKDGFSVQQLMDEKGRLNKNKPKKCEVSNIDRMHLINSTESLMSVK
jgi:hypothetical protein